MFFRPRSERERRHTSRASRMKTTRRLHLEALEDRAVPAVVLSIPTNLVVAPGATISVPVNFQTGAADTVNLSSMDFHLKFDDTKFSISNVQLGTLDAGFGSVTTNIIASSQRDSLTAAASTASPILISPNTSGTLLKFDLKALATATGNSVLDIQLNSRPDTVTTGVTFRTRLNDGAVTLNPALSNTSGDASDGKVTFQAATPPGVTITPTTGLTTTEAGGTATFTAVLATQPTGDVVIPLSSSNTAEGTVSPASLTFTSANWNVAQTVTLTGVDDAIDDGDVAYSIVTGPATSTDVGYSGLNPADVSATNTDDDAAGITVTPTTGLTTTEAGGTAIFTVVLATQPTADVSIAVSSSNTAEGTVSPLTLTFTAANWNVAQTVTVTGVDDALVDGDIAYSIVTGAATSSDTKYSGLNPSDVAVTNSDNDTAGVTVTPTAGLTTTEAGGTAIFTVVLTSQPTGDVTIPLSSSNTAEGTVSPASLTFTAANWNVAQTVTVTGVDDAVFDGDIAYSIVTGAATSSDALYSGVNPSDISVTNTDNEVFSLVINEILLNPPGTDSPNEYVELKGTPGATIPAGTYLLGIEGDASSTGDVQNIFDLSGKTIGSNGFLVLLQKGNTYVTAAGSSVYTNSGTGAGFGSGAGSSIGHSADSAATDIENASVTFLLVTTATAPTLTTDIDSDNEGTPDGAAYAGFTILDSIGSLDNSAAGDFGYGVLTYTNSTGGGASKVGTVVPVAFTAGYLGRYANSTGGTKADWVASDILGGTAPNFTLGTGANVSNALLAGSPLDNIGSANRPFPGFTVSPTTGLATTEAGGTAAFTVVLNIQPTADVTIAISSSNTAEGTVSVFSLTFTAANWDTPQTVTLTGVDDAADDGDVAYTIVTGAATSTDPAYTGLNPSDVTASNTDDDTTGVTVTPTSGLNTSEAGGTATFTVVLTSQPTADVTIPLSSSNTAEGTVSPASLTFTTANWNVAQTVTVTGVDDLVADGGVAYTIVTGAATSTDATYTGFNASDVSVTNFDNDSAGISVTPTTGLTTTEAAGTATFTIVLGSQPTADVTIPLSSSNTAEGTVSPSSVTFTAANWNVPQTVTLSGVDDAVDDGDIAYTIVTGAATSADAAFNGLDASDVSATNTDNDTAGITVTPTTGLATTEAGGTATFTVVLTSQPTADVVIPISSSNTAEGTVSPASLTFTAANWNVPQTVTLTGVDDAVVDGDIAYSIVTGSAVSTDALYSGLNPSDVAAINVDNDIPTVVLNEVVVNVPGTDNPFEYIELRGVANQLLFHVYFVSVEGDGATAGTADMVVNLSTAVLGSNGLLVIKSPTGGNTTPAATSIVTDAQLDTAGGGLENGTNSFVLIFSSTPIVEGTDLDTNNDGVFDLPAGASLIDGVGWTDGGAGDIAYAAILTQSSGTPDAATRFVDDLTPLSAAAFYNGDLAGTLPTSQSYQASQASANLPNGAVITPGDANFAAPAGVIVTPLTGLTTTEAGGTATFTVVLNAKPTADVVIPISSADTTEGTVSPSSLTFTAANWNVPQTVTVTGVDDAVDDGDVAFDVIISPASSTDASYNGIGATNATATNDDDDTANISVTPTSGLTTLGTASTTTFTIVLTSQPLGDVTVPLSSSDTTRGTVSPSLVTFTAANWNVPQTVTVTGGLTAGAFTVLTGAATSGDGLYSGFDASDVSVTNDTAAFVESVVVDNGLAQRSMVRSLTVTFNEVVTLDADAFTVQSLSGGGAVTANFSSSTVAGKTVAVLTFTGATVVGGSLEDGNYKLTVVATKVHDGSGQELDGDHNGVAGDNATTNFYRFFGDSNGDRKVDSLDYAALFKAFGSITGGAKYLDYLDYDNSGSITLLDSNQFKTRLGKKLNP